jgi:hypothetical protein
VSRLVAVVAVAVALFSTSCMQERAIAPAVDSRPETSTSTSTSLSSTTVPNSSSTQLPGSTTTLAPGTTTTTTRPPQVVTVTTNVDLGLPFAEEPATTERRDGAVRTFIDYERIPPFSTILVQNLGDETIPAVTVVDLIETSPTRSLRTRTSLRRPFGRSTSRPGRAAAAANGGWRPHRSSSPAPSASFGPGARHDCRRVLRGGAGEPGRPSHRVAALSRLTSSAATKAKRYLNGSGRRRGRSA